MGGWIVGIASFVLVHALIQRNLPQERTLLRYSLVFTTSFAYALEKVYNTELGFISMQNTHWLWAETVAGVAFLGLTDFYMNFRAAWSLPAHLFVPMKFALSIVLQLFQGAIVLDEFKTLTPMATALTFCGAFVALAASLSITQAGVT